MRLSKEEVTVIKSSIEKFDPQAQIYLFGSRADPNKKGGDIDILILSKVLNEQDKIKIEMAIFEELEEQKIDLVIAKNDSKPFIKIALKTGIKL